LCEVPARAPLTAVEIRAVEAKAKGVDGIRKALATSGVVVFCLLVLLWLWWSFRLADMRRDLGEQFAGLRGDLTVLNDWKTNTVDPQLAQMKGAAEGGRVTPEGGNKQEVAQDAERSSSPGQTQRREDGEPLGGGEAVASGAARELRASLVSMTSGDQTIGQLGMLDERTGLVGLRLDGDGAAAEPKVRLDAQRNRSELHLSPGVEGPAAVLAAESDGSSLSLRQGKGGIEAKSGGRVPEITTRHPESGDELARVSGTACAAAEPGCYGGQVTVYGPKGQPRVLVDGRSELRDDNPREDLGGLIPAIPQPVVFRDR